MTKGSLKGQVFSFNKTNVLIGRGPENDIIINNDTKMSRRHIEIKNTGFEVTVINISQKNHMLIDGEKCEHKLITKPTVVTIGDTEIYLSVENQVPSTAKPQKAILQSVNQQPVTSQIVSKNLITPAHLKTQQNAITSDFNNTHNARPKNQERPQPRNEYRPVQSSPQKGFNMMIAILVLVGLAGYLFMSDQKQKKSDTLRVRNSKDIEKELDLSTSNIDSWVKIKKDSGQNTLEYQTAQEKYLSGFRDYRNGQYYRAMIFFQGALASYPDHALAKKYYHLAKRKFDDQVQMHMQQGRKYRAKGNYSLCKSSFKSVLVMIKDPNEPVYKEANQIYNECHTLSEGRF